MGLCCITVFSGFSGFELRVHVFSLVVAETAELSFMLPSSILPTGLVMTVIFRFSESADLNALI